MTTGAITPKRAKARLHGGGEIAFLDVREAGQFGEEHPMFAVPCPYSRLELEVEALVPNRRVPVLLLDAGDGVSERAARRLDGLGYSDVSVVAGGAPAWAAAGLTLFKGVNVPSKTLGELAEAIWHPQTVDAATLDAWREEKRRLQLFDSRPPAEHSKMRPPGSVCLPNGELAHRFAAAVSDPELPVVVHCAGRTRSITGAIGLRLAGVPNPVFALENGTQGWTLAGLELERGAAALPYPDVDEAARAGSRERALRFIQDWGIPSIESDGIAALQSDPTRTVYIFDVRSREEYDAGHFPGAVHAPGGQLVQASDQWIGVRRACVVLCDDTGMRAALAAFWLRQLGFQPYVLAGADVCIPSLPGSVREEGPSLRPTLDKGSALVPISPGEANNGMAEGKASILDLRPSQDYRAGHAAGAIWTTRPRLGRSLLSARGVGAPAPVTVLVADDPALAELAAMDLREAGLNEIRILEGGMAAWQRAGLPVEVSPERPSPDEAIDFLQFVHDRHDGNLEAARRYLEWEQGLVAQLDPEERSEFRLERPVQG
jgi:rhodanese-related sulfurtransferase